MASSRSYTLNPAAKSTPVPATVNWHTHPASGGHASLYRTHSGEQLELEQFFFPGKPGIDSLPEFLTRLEMRHMLGSQCHRFTGLGIPANARRTVMQGETSKPPDLNPLPAGQCPAHLFKQTFNGQLDILVIKVAVLSRKYLDQFRLCHFLTNPDQVVRSSKPNEIAIVP